MGALQGPLLAIWVKSPSRASGLFQICDSRPLRFDSPHGRSLIEGPACAPCRRRL